MDQLITRVCAQLGLPEARAEQAVGRMFALLREHGGGPVCDALLDALPGAGELAEKHPGEPAGLMASLGGPALAAYTQLTAIGLDTAQIESLGREVMTYSREQAGEDKVDAVIASIPGLDGIL